MLGKSEILATNSRLSAWPNVRTASGQVTLASGSDSQGVGQDDPLRLARLTSVPVIADDEVRVDRDVAHIDGADPN